MSCDPIAWYEGSAISSATRRYLLADRLGSITNVVADNGTSLAINRYDESGIPSPANMGRFGYTGQTWLAGIGLWHYKARMYSPTLGRFMQTDPIGYGDGMNMYGYVGGDPVNSVDPTGLACQVLHRYYRDVFANGESGEIYGPLHSRGVSITGCQTNPVDTNALAGDRDGRDADRGTARERAEQGLRQWSEPDGGAGGDIANVGTIVWDRYKNARDTGLSVAEAMAVALGLRAVTGRPRGSVGLDRSPWSSQHAQIKESIGAGPTDNVFIGRDGTVWLELPDGSYEDWGDVRSISGTNSPKPKGRIHRGGR